MTLPLGNIIAILFVHWIADFVLQSDWQAKNKSKNNAALIAHVSSYTIALLVYGLLFLPVELAYPWALINGFLHLCVDYVTGRINTYLWSKGRVHDFFVSVGFDQFLHIATLLLTFGMLQNL
jgi:hypothetical protein